MNSRWLKRRHDSIEWLRFNTVPENTDINALRYVYKAVIGHISYNKRYKDRYIFCNRSFLVCFFYKWCGFSFLVWNICQSGAFFQQKSQDETLNSSHEVR